MKGMDEGVDTFCDSEATLTEMSKWRVCAEFLGLSKTSGLAQSCKGNRAQNTSAVLAHRLQRSNLNPIC